MIRDDGIGMTFDECQSLYLAVGRNRRGEETEGRTAGDRPVLGRKSIGKLAGFGIASLMTVATVSRATGERTVFRLDGLNWHALLGEAEAGWRDFLDILEARGEGGLRMEEHFQAVRGKTENPRSDESRGASEAGESS